MTVTAGPTDRTNLLSENGNLIAELIANPDLLKTVLSEIYDYLDANWNDYSNHKTNTVLDHPDGSVTTPKIADSGVTTIKLADLAVTTSKLVDLAVTSGKINDLAVLTGKLADLAVTTAKIADLAITTGKLADGSVISQKLADASVITSKIADGNVTASKLDESTYSKIAGMTGSSLNTNDYTWTATGGQQTFNLPANTSYEPGYKRLEVYVGGVPQTNFTETSSTSFTVAEALTAGTAVYARWYEGSYATTAHHVTHLAGGSDEINVTQLAGYNDLEILSIMGVY